MKLANFTEKKFLSLSTKQQQKHLAYLLKLLYEEALQGRETRAILCVYNDLQAHIKGPELESLCLQEISNRFHSHLEKSKISLKEHRLLPAIRKGDRQAPSSPPLPIGIYLDHLRSAHNVGSILRSIEAFQLGPVYFSEQTPGPDHKQVRDAAMGADKWLKMHLCANLKSLPRPLIALETSEEALSLYDFLFPERFCLAVGNEEYGCSKEVLAQADHLIQIPLQGRKNSLNVANAFAIAASEIRRQRGGSSTEQTPKTGF